MVEFVQYWRERADMKVGQLVSWLGISPSKYYQWRTRAGQPNRHNGQVPKENWLEAWEKEAIVAYYQQHPDEGYRRLCYMMLDENVVAVSPSSVYRVLTEAGLLKRWARSASPLRRGLPWWRDLKGTVQPAGMAGVRRNQRQQRSDLYFYFDFTCLDLAHIKLAAGHPMLMHLLTMFAGSLPPLLDRPLIKAKGSHNCQP